jgi:hypothetical protein
MNDIFKEIIYKNTHTKNFNIGFSLGKYSNTKTLHYNTVASGCVSRSRGSLERIMNFNNNNTETVNNNFLINNWKTVNPIIDSLGNWFNIVCSKSGQYVVATNPNIYKPSIFISNNYGNTFVENLYDDSYHNYSNLAIDSSGNYFLCPAIRDLIFNSTNYGETIGTRK